MAVCAADCNLGVDHRVNGCHIRTVGMVNWHMAIASIRLSIV